MRPELAIRGQKLLSGRKRVVSQKLRIFLHTFFQVCHGSGASKDASQIDAARRALVMLADSGDNLNEAGEDEDEQEIEAKVETATSGSETTTTTTVNGGVDSSVPVVSAAEL